MNIYPIQNIVDSVYRSSNDLQFNISINIEDSIFRSLLMDNQYFNSIYAGDSIEQMNYLHNTININAYISSDYLNHFQNKSLFNTYHIKDFVVFLNPPIKLLKREDIILIRNRLESTKKILISSDIANTWTNIDAPTIEPGIRPIELNNTEPRNSVIILSNNDKNTQKIYQVLQNKLGNINIVSNVDNYDNIMRVLNQHKICINMGPCIDSIYGLAAGCKVISKIAINTDVEEYDSLNDLEKLVVESISTYDIKKQVDIGLKTHTKYNYEKFEGSIANYITSNIMEPFLI